jgi:ATP-binding cassette subfamily B (MDR/TAP) protein 1
MGAGMAASFAGDQAKAAAAKDRIFRLLQRVPPIDAKPWDEHGEPRAVDEKRIIPSEYFKGGIVLNNVTFAYPTRVDANVFRNTSINIPAGATVALVGTSGSGKSTTIQLLERFYDPTDETSAVSREVDVKVEQQVLPKADPGNLPNNCILIDGYDLKSLDLKWVRSKVALVGQEPVLFQGSISENIAHGKPGATMEEIQAAAEAANAHEFITKHPDGYDRQVGDRGNQLSGGQKQRIAIARAIIKNPSILLLDEATSALDNESEKIVQKSLDDLLARKDVFRTTIVIAHRLSTIINADIIYVLDNDGQGARVVESGTHDELMRLENGVYRKLRAAYDTQN